MKKDKKIRMLDDFASCVDEDKETFFSVYANGNSVACHAIGDGDNLKEAFKCIIANALRQDADEGSIFAAGAIVEAVCEMSEQIESQVWIYGDGKPQSQCEDCRLMRTCNDKQAIAYRKANGIPKPKKHKPRNIDVD